MSSNGNGANSGDVSSSHGSSGSHGETGSLPDSSRPDFSSGGEPVGPPAPTAANAASGAPTSFVKLAMRNMVRKGRQSLLHFGLTALGLMAFLVLIAWLGRPSLPQ
jgi:hypothetical protein